jgi:energy-coupling factor transporter ATP-binding protein EcfA2
MNATIEIDGLRKRFGPVQALDGMTFTVQPGRVTGFVGPNGAGKSTTMRVIVGLDAPDAGTATIGGRPYRTLKNPLTHVGSLPDAGALQPGRSGRNHLLWLAHSQGIKAGRVDEVIALAGLESAARRDTVPLPGDRAAREFLAPGARRVDQVPHRAWLGHRGAHYDPGDYRLRVPRRQCQRRVHRGLRASAADSTAACPVQPTGPGGEPVQDAFYFVHRQLTGNGTITAQLTSLTGQVDVGPGSNGQPQTAPGLWPWSKAGIIIKGQHRFSTGSGNDGKQPA